MALIADSDAVLDVGRILPQHQAALTLLNTRLQDPDVTEFSWLDLACGRGQIIAQLLENLTPGNRKKLTYVGFDINVDHTRSAEQLASKLALRKYEFHQGDLSRFADIISDPQKFDFITCTNTAHEVEPIAFTKIILDSILRLSETGELFVYDMESLTEPELGALPWNAKEISSISKVIFDILEPRFEVQPSTWSHRNVKGWNATIPRKFIKKKDSEILEIKPQIMEKLKIAVQKILKERFEECNKVLDAFCRFGAATPAEEQDKLSALYKFWALHRAIGERA